MKTPDPLVVLSSRYIPSDMIAHYGMLPPAFLPLGSRRLFEIQVEWVSHARILLTLPDDFVISKFDQELIDRNSIEILRLPAHLSLADAMATAIDKARLSGPMRLLFGDTLVSVRQDVEHMPDWLAIADKTVNFPWTYDLGPTSPRNTDAPGREGVARFANQAPAPGSGLDQTVVTGFFSIADAGLLKTCAQMGGALADILNRYEAERPFVGVHVEQWFDFGHAVNYYEGRREMLSSRAFNNVRYEDGMIYKSSSQTQKMRAEATWFENLPKPLILNAPRYLGRCDREHRAGYHLEYLHLPTLDDLMFMSALPQDIRSRVLSASLDLLDRMQAIRPPDGSPEASATFATEFFAGMLVGKTKSRFADFLRSRGIDGGTQIRIGGRLLPPLEELPDFLLSAIPPTTPDDIRFWHGDFFYGNLLYDFVAHRALAVDPRGVLSDGAFSSYGDRRYDIAKLAHSVLGGYDLIVKGRGRLATDGANSWRFVCDIDRNEPALGEEFLLHCERRLDVERNVLRAMTSTLFLSMLPLHAEDPDRQDVLLAAGLTLAADVEEIMS